MAASETTNAVARAFSHELRGRPVGVVDVGAAGGYMRRFLAYRDFVRFVGFEPDPRSYDAVAAASHPRDVVLPVALGRADEKRTLHLTRKGECSSLLEPDHDILGRFPDARRFDAIERLPVTTTTLDGALAEAGIPTVEVIKLDTQGTELDILHGADAALAGCLAVEIEVEFQALYRGQPLLPEVTTFLTRYGFELFDVAPVRWKLAGSDRTRQRYGQAVFSDCLFMRPAHSLSGAGRGRAIAAAFVHSTYGYYDHAISILDESPDVAADEVDLARTLSVAGDRSRLPAAVQRFLHRLGRRLVRQYDGKVFAVATKSELGGDAF